MKSTLKNPCVQQIALELIVTGFFVFRAGLVQVMSLAGGMYSLPPLADMTSKLDLPSCMYSLPVLQSSSHLQQGADDPHQVLAEMINYA